LSDEDNKLFGRLRQAIGAWSEQRGQLRHQGPPRLVVKIEGKKYTTEDWSIGGLRLASFERPVKPKDIISGTFMSGIPKVKDRRFEARVIRAIATGEVGLQYMEISHEAFTALREVINELH